MKQRIVSLPWMGKEYTNQIKKTLESLDIKVLLPPIISNETIKKGVKYSADMMCFPFKVTLGNFIEALDQGANTLLMYDSCGQCRLRHYYKIHELTLRQLGYDFEIFPVNAKNILSVFKKLSGKSTIATFNAVKDLIKKIYEIDKQRYVWSKEKLNIGIIGEIYTCCEEKVNYRIEDKLKKFGVNPFNTSNLSDFIKESLKEKFFCNFIGKRKYKKMAKEYLNGPLGGHGLENIYNLLWLKDKKVDGIIHLLPLSCMPEATIEPIINLICQENKIPFLRLPIDETNSEANVDTRVETFIELIKRKRKAVNLKKLNANNYDRLTILQTKV